MEVIPFLEYLREQPASRELAESLVQVFQLRRRTELIPAGMELSMSRRVAS
ncbi:MAG TPA: hypothetical protein VL769_02160 [Acidimicrobiia bacterium]|jgi:hypothetical protein|nr:hypothetical protein [Acidimicrobiia bacterium]